MKLILFLQKLLSPKHPPSHLDEVYYISTNQPLPPPLTAEEEALMLAQLPAKNPTVIQTLIEHNLRLVIYIARKYESTTNPANTEDLISIGTIGLIKAINTYDPAKNIKLATYASRCIENEILMQLRRQSRQKQEVSLDEPLNIDHDGNELLLSDIMGTEEDIIYHTIEKDINHTLLQKALNILSPRERTIIQLRYGLNNQDEQTQKEVAQSLGISQSYISRLEKKIIRRLKKELLKSQ